MDHSEGGSSHPGHYARHVLTNVFKLWNTSEYPAWASSTSVFILRGFSALVTVLGLAGAGMSLLRVKGWPLPALPALILLYVPAIHVFLHTEARYTATVRVILLMQAAALIAWLLVRFDCWSASRLARP